MSEQPTDGSPGDIPFGLLWGIKRSFIAYVRRTPDGRGSIHDGAVPLGEDTVLFPVDEAAPGATADADHAWGFRGDVRFMAHGGMLFVRVAEPRITVRGDEAELSIADPYERPDADRVPLVTLRLEPGPAPDGARVWLGSDVRLTEPGAVLFNEVYQPGEQFEQLSVVLPLRD